MDDFYHIGQALATGPPTPNHGVQVPLAGPPSEASLEARQGLQPQASREAPVIPIVAYFSKQPFHKSKCDQLSH